MKKDCEICVELIEEGWPFAHPEQIKEWPHYRIEYIDKNGTTIAEGHIYLPPHILPEEIEILLSSSCHAEGETVSA